MRFVIERPRIAGIAGHFSRPDGERFPFATNRSIALMAWFVLGFAFDAAPAFAQDASAGADARRPPNIVFILSDDEDVALHEFMPKTKRLVEDQGAVFDNAFVTYSLCCPSRTSIFRGQYPHNTRVQGNLPPEGGFQAFRALGRGTSTVATWLQAAGYRTAFYGKFLNGYAETDPQPPGWDEWHAANNAGYLNFDYELNENGKVVAYGHAPEDYLTDVIASKAAAHIRRWSAAGEPFYLHVAPFNPHSPYTPAPRHAKLFADTELPRPPSFNEVDVSDKPTWVRKLPRLDEKDIAEITGHYRARLQCLQAVDDLVETLVKTLEETGQLDNTWIVYASDNGFHLGEHRLKEGKDTAYEEDIRVPLAIRGPGMTAGIRIDRTALNIDFAPTFAAITGAEPTHEVDGRSLLPLLDGSPPDTWRRHFVIERRGLETDERALMSSATAVRTDRRTFVAYEDGERELYDLEADPHQLDSLHDTVAPAVIDALTMKLSRFRGCAGDECRAQEDEALKLP